MTKIFLDVHFFVLPKKRTKDRRAAGGSCRVKGGKQLKVIAAFKVRQLGAASRCLRPGESGLFLIRGMSFFFFYQNKE